jgi:hypothetical protein
MTLPPGERFNLIRSVYTTLSESPDWDWELVETLLSEFGAEGSGAEGFGPRIMERVRSLSDDELIALHRHLEPAAATDTTNTPPAEGPWEEGQFRLFISHTSPNARLAGAVREWMAQVKIDAFVAHTDIEPTEPWQDVIETALRTCHALVAFLTPDFSGSRWCDQEVGFAVGRGILIIPVRMGDDPYGFVGRVQAMTFGQADFARRYELSDQLFGLLTRSPITAELMVDPVLARFAESGSFAGAREAWPHIARLPRDAWTTERVQIVRDAADQNSQLRHGVLLANGSGRKFPVVLEQHLEALGIPLD